MPFQWRDRLFEWIMAVAMFSIGVQMMMWADTMRASSFRHILRIIDSDHLGLFFLIFGAIRMMALVANGGWPKYGPWMRATGAGVAAMLWGQLCVSLMLLFPFNNGIPSPGIPVYFALTIGELISAYRAIYDARHSR
jgi:hypothetical protein